LNAPSDGSNAIAGGSAFQIFAAATGKAQSPMVLCNDRGTCSDGDDADRTRLRDSMSEQDKASAKDLTSGKGQGFHHYAQNKTNINWRY